MCFLVRKPKAAAIIDPAPGSADAIAEYIEKQHLKPEKLLLTHSHWDHIADAAPLIKGYGLQTLIHPLDVPNLESPGADQLPCWITIEGRKARSIVSEGDQIQIREPNTAGDSHSRAYSWRCLLLRTRT